jgi:hypothetical protein
MLCALMVLTIILRSVAKVAFYRILEESRGCFRTFQTVKEVDEHVVEREPPLRIGP